MWRIEHNNEICKTTKIQGRGLRDCVMAVLFILPIRVLYALWNFMLATKFTCK